ncbi:hypothetical protein K505DRAFT_341750 [Melanomma pulvis-pyrius CBS 109.77]|uniref:Cytochrome P450 n=1 Tax=Melanomma pulvis-pyrius CBS 109.77 TaxID=1314802 RepID=A0A6A6WXM3_9PLEO|nr:hypothetical protein K505DRAFT_341750 [Melanomma pulvis-pyrius CBS 109.77]
MTNCTFYLLNSPPVLQRLQQELDATIPDPSNMPGMQIFEELPYLNAVMKECLRLQAISTSRLEVVCPTLVLRYKDWVIAHGIPVATKIEAALFLPTTTDFSYHVRATKDSAFLYRRCTDSESSRMRNCYLAPQYALPIPTLGSKLACIRHHLSKSLSPQEITTPEIVAGALGLAPFTSGFTAFIPALEFLTTTDESGPVSLNAAQLILWSVATCTLGIVTTAPFRRLFILRERLRYPSATATGTLISFIFGGKAIIDRARQGAIYTHSPQILENGPTPEPPGSPSSRSVSSSVFDRGLVPQNVELALNVLLVSLAGSLMFSLVNFLVPILNRVPIFGHAAAREWLWAFNLSPAYLGYGIIIGPSTNAYTSLGAILGWTMLSPLAKHRGWAPALVEDCDEGSRGWILWVGMGLILGDSAIGLSWFILNPFASWGWRELRLARRGRPYREDLIVKILQSGNPYFRKTRIRNLKLMQPIARRVAQLIIGLLVPSSRSGYMSANLLLGGLVEAGASQASQHMGGQKTAYVTETAPRAVFYGQMIEFGVPDAHVWLVAARLIHQQGLPDRDLEFSIGAFVMGAGLSLLRIVARRYWRRDFVVWCCNGCRLILVICRDTYGIKYFVLLCCATGLILGQGMFSIVALALDVLTSPNP